MATGVAVALSIVVTRPSSKCAIGTLLPPAAGAQLGEAGDHLGGGVRPGGGRPATSSGKAGDQLGQGRPWPPGARPAPCGAHVGSDGCLPTSGTPPLPGTSPAPSASWPTPAGGRSRSPRRSVATPPPASPRGAPSS